MTTLWLLVVIAGNMGGHGWGNRITVAEFSSLERCEAARDFVKETPRNTVRAECFPK